MIIISRILRKAEEAEKRDGETISTLAFFKVYFIIYREGETRGESVDKTDGPSRIFVLASGKTRLESAFRHNRVIAR